MDSVRLSRLSNLRELVSLLSLSVQIQGETAAILEDYECRLSTLEEDRTHLFSDYKALSSRCQSLERRYSELLYKFAELKEARP